METRKRNQPIGSCGMKGGFSSCEVAGVIASGLIHDLRVNNFCFSNFPEIDIDWDDDNFHITFIVNGISGSTFNLDHKTVKTEVMNFRKKKELNKEIFNIIQHHAAELEGLVSKT